MYLISAEGYKNAGVDMLIEKETGLIWAKMKNVHDGLGLQNMPDPVLKQVYGKKKTKNLTKEQVKKYKMTDREIFEKYDNLSEEELNTKNNKNAYVTNDGMTTLLNVPGEKKEVKEKQMRLEKN